MRTAVNHSIMILISSYRSAYLSKRSSTSLWSASSSSIRSTATTLLCASLWKHELRTCCRLAVTVPAFKQLIAGLGARCSLMVQRALRKSERAANTCAMACWCEFRCKLTLKMFYAGSHKCKVTHHHFVMRNVSRLWLGDSWSPFAQCCLQLSSLCMLVGST